MEAIVLAGGFGTRLQHIVSNVPKPMAPVCGRPFLEYLLAYLQRNGVIKVVLATGYMHEVIERHFSTGFGGLSIQFSMEDVPLMTGGAVKKALGLCSEERIFVVNGDTFFDVDLQAMYRFSEQKQTPIVIAAKELPDTGRYGKLQLEDTRITAFDEKNPWQTGAINGGIYCMRRDFLAHAPVGAFSLEEYMQQYAGTLEMHAFFSLGYFIDIGIEADYKKVQADFQGGDFL